MERRSLYFSPIKAVMALIFTVIFLGCAGTQRGSISSIPPEHLIPIENTPSQKTIWTGDELRIEVRRAVQADGLELNGKIFLTGGIQYFTSIDHMRVEIFFTNAEGALVGRNLFYSAGYRVPVDESGLSFHRFLSIPGGATHMAFGYDGRVREGGGGSFRNGDDGGIDYSFWFSPVQ